MSIIAQLEQIKDKYFKQEIDYAEAKKQANPLINKFNAVSREKAKKYNLRPKTISFAGFMR